VGRGLAASPRTPPSLSAFSLDFRPFWPQFPTPITVNFPLMLDKTLGPLERAREGKEGKEVWG